MGFFGNRGSEQIKAETLLGCLKLYGSEVLEKGMQKLVDESDFQNLGVLYEYFEIVGEVDLLKKAVCGVIEVGIAEIGGIFVVEKRADFWELFGEGDRGVDRREAGGE